ncbi:virulence factor [Novosphingobium sp. SG720]|uniref:virulence factor n=1 Tax=Novosphingobium sp. SG720 TaxID=2586998 RepID=UPI0017E4DA41|nr:virulence factor [Novosphingobium sp. SG720]NKJ42796.1 type IV secretory pathway VirJ component [Novosphingobium sp. SG720]
MAIGFLGRKLFALAAALPAVAGGTMAAGGYFDRQAVLYRGPLGPPRHDLVVVYFSGDMGLALGAGGGTIAALRDRGLPVVTVNSPALFGVGRDRAFVDALVADTMRQALARSHAAHIALIGAAFGAGVLDTGLGAVPADLRARIASVVLVAPARTVYFQANPGGLFHPGAPDSDPRRTVRLLHGLPVTCIFENDSTDSLCRTTQLDGARRVPLGNHRLAQISADAALYPPLPMH